MHGRGKPVFSFEFFPPKSDEHVAPLLKTIAELKSALEPNFVSVTNGAGGSTRARTLQTVSRVQLELGLTAMAHLTCSGVTQDDLCNEIGNLLGQGIENILALRGDPPKGDGAFKPVAGGFAHASDLIEYLDSNYQVDIGAACYPEGHVESSNRDDDLRFTKLKVDSGALFLVTQLFFDNRDYFAFVERARNARIRVPIVPGIMPITNVAQVERFTKMCGAKIPAELAERLRSAQDDPAAVMAIGIEHAVLQCRTLLEGGAPGLHFYTLNKSFATRSVLAAVRRV
ncbi:MAG: methylenetetrahydrofolate reductase [NAD(P)H] [Planctomycetaceae bacterium]|jgi:methylenetetrahydrofolate reductase (NADPH)|nr:methylenetetrahydrofolate reductase [NAD(P)H] [Planctomycetaceae bacterium]